MATIELVIAGFGGQGILFAGQALAHAAVSEGRHVTWMPAYGPEQRGGTATCTVVIGDEPIGSPVVADPPAVIVMNRPSMDKFEPRVRAGGLLVINSSMVDRPAQREDVRVIAVDAVREATALGDARAANMVLLGAFLAVVPVVSPSAVQRALREMLSPGKAQIVDLNLAAVARGGQVAREQMVLQR
jgi:2-oxoglutarate ferredoxin oxidoreductase subunit gamma